MMTDTKGTTTWINRQFQTMGLRFKVVTTGMKTMWAGTMSFMKKTASSVGKFMNKAFKILMVFSMLVMLWDMIKPYIDKVFGTDFAGSDDPLMETVESAKKLNKELALMAKRFREKVGGEGSLKEALDTAVFQGNMATSSDLKGRMQVYKDADEGKAKQGLFTELSDTVAQLSAVRAGFNDVSIEMNAAGIISDSTASRILELSDSMMNAKTAAVQLREAESELFKLNNNFLNSTGKLKYGGMISANRRIKETASSVQNDQAIEFGEVNSALIEVARKRTARETLTDNEIANFEAWGSRFVELLMGFQASQRGEKGSLGEKISTATGEENALLGYSKDVITEKGKKQGFDIEKNSIRRQGQSAQYLKKELDIKKNLADIEIVRINIKVQERILNDKNAQVEQVEAATLAIQQENLNIDAIKAKNSVLRDTMDTLSNLKIAAVDALETGMATALMGVIDGTKTMKEGFLDMAKVVLQAIAQIIVKMIAMKAISAMGFGFADGGVIPRANGGYMFGGKQPKGYRSGGVVTEPTYLVGEGKYNEAVVPLPDGRSIPVMMKGGSGGNANVTVNISCRWSNHRKYK